MSTTPILQAVVAAGAPPALGPYSHGMLSAPLDRCRALYLSGQTPIDPATGRLVDGDISRQVQQVLQNLSAVLAAAGAGPHHVAKASVFLRDMADFAALNAQYERYFGDHRPARTTVAVAGLPLDARVEIDFVAIVP